MAGAYRYSIAGTSLRGPLHVISEQMVMYTVDSVMCIVTKRLRLELRGFHYEVPLHLNYPHIKFDKIKRESLRISTIIFLLDSVHTDVYVTLYLQSESPFRYVCHMPPPVSTHRRRTVSYTHLTLPTKRIV